MFYEWKIVTTKIVAQIWNAWISIKVARKAHFPEIFNVQLRVQSDGSIDDKLTGGCWL